MARLLRIPLGAPRLTLVVMAALTAFFAYFAASIRVDSSIENLLPKDDPDRRYYEDVRRTFGNEEITVIGIHAEDVFTPATLTKIDQLSKQLEAISGVQEVLSLTTVKGAEMDDGVLNVGKLMRELPTTPAAAADFRRRVFANPLYVKNLVAPDARAAAISVAYEPMSDREFLARGIEERMRGAVEAMRGPERFTITGIPTLKVYGALFMERDIFKFTPLSLLLVVLVLIATFGTIRGVLIPLATILIGVVWTTGLMVLLGDDITMGTLVLNPLLMVVGIASGIHMVSQYYLEVHSGRQPMEVVTATLEHVRVPIAIAATTTLIGLATLIWTPITAVRDFGIYSVFGIAVILVSTFSVVPAWLALLPLPTRGPQAHDESGLVLSMLRSISDFAVRYRRTMLAAGVVVLLICAVGIARIRVETDYLSFFHPQSTIRVDNQLIADQLAGTQPIYVVIEGGDRRAVVRQDVLAATWDLQRFIDQQPGVDKTMSLVDYVGIIRRLMQDDPQLPPVPDTQSEIEQYLQFMDPADVRAVVNADYSRANIIVRTRLAGSSEVATFVRNVEGVARERFPGGIQVRATGSVVLLNRSADALVWGQVTGLWQELFVLLLLLSALFVSIRVGVLALIPNVIPTVILFGIMGWSGVSLNISTSMIAAIAIGIAIDDTIHLLSSFNNELRRSGNQERAVRYAIRSAGQAAVYIAVALTAGFLIVCLSNFQPVKHFGYLSAATMGVALVTELFFTPALLATTKIVTLWDLLFLRLGPEPHRQIPLFAGLRPFQAKIVVLMAHLANAGRGTFITRTGELKAELYVLLKGRADVRRGDSDLVIRTLGRGDVIGEMGLVRRRPRSADVVVVDDAEYLVLDDRFLARIRRQYPRIAATVFLNLTQVLSDRLESTTDQLVAEHQPEPEGEAITG
jgi:predicted RND superfamily exporter protein